MRTETKAIKNMRRMHCRQGLDEKAVYHKAKMVLAIYRDVVWVVRQTVDDTLFESRATFGRDLDAALTYLSDFAPDEKRRNFEERVTCLFETKWMIDLIDTAMLRVYDYHTNGKLYHEILSKCYMAFMPYSEAELLETLCMERSTYYEKKKEAVTLFSIALWGYAIPELKTSVFSETQSGENLCINYL